MKLFGILVATLCLCLYTVETHSHAHTDSKHKHFKNKCGFKHNRIPELGIGAEMPKSVKDDPMRRKLYSQSRPFKIHLDISNVRGVSAEIKEYLVNLVAKEGNAILASKIGISGYGVVPANSRIQRYCNYDNIVSVPDQYKYQNVEADFLLFLATDDTGDDGTLAYATACFLERGTSRPNTGLAVFNPFYLDPGKGKLDNDVATYVHEVLHALVFSSQLWANFPPVNGQPQYFVDPSDGKHYLRGKWLLQTVRDHFNCPSVTKVPLEDDGGEGSEGGHFERIVFGDETMVSEDVAVAKFSKMTLALLKDSGWYDIDLGKGDYYTWGKDEGCKLVQNRSFDTTIDELCSKNNNFGCDKTFQYKMDCQATTFTGDYKIKTKGTSCSKGEHNFNFFETTGINSKCQELFYHGQKMAGCVEVLCNRSKTLYQVSLKGNSPKKFICSRENEIKKTWEGFDFVCENPKLICSSYCPKNCYNRGKCMENGECACDPFFSGEICGTFKGCMGLPYDLCKKVVLSNKMNYKNYVNTYTSSDFDPNYLSYTSWTDYYNRYLVQTDTGI